MTVIAKLIARISSTRAGPSNATITAPANGSASKTNSKFGIESPGMFVRR
jgi:hypothetical protein